MSPKHRNIILYIAASLDGYIARQDGRIDWLSMVETKGEDYGYARFYQDVDTILIGRKTYDQTLLFGQNPPFPGKACYVFSKSKPSEKSEKDVVFVHGNVATLVKNIRKQSGKNMWLVGGGELIHAFMEADLIDEYIISTIPIVLGSGIPLFRACGREIKVRLQQSVSFPSGLVQTRYATNRTERGGN